MALSNYERVGKAVALLGEGLAPFVERECRAQFGDDWTTGVQRANTRGPGRPRPVNPTDAQFLLKVMWDEWNTIFSKKLSRNDRSYVSELQTVRNSWAHNDSFSTDDALRALDTARRLLESAGSGAQANEVDRLHGELLRLKFDEQARNVSRRAAGAQNGGAPSAGIPGWRSVIEPHDDVSTGRFRLVEFAADLHKVWRGEAASEYGDPVEFYRRTYITEGLASLIVGAVRCFSGEGGDPVVQLQTNFGGGKTHSLIALYHLAGGTPAPQLKGVEDLLAAHGLELPSEPVRRAVLVGHQLGPGDTDTKGDGTVVRTMWGELAYQLGGAEGYALVSEADRRGTNPGESLTALLRSCAPCLILIDEWVGYARQLYGQSELPAGTFDAHFSFAQALTEAAAATPGALLVATIPSSQIEVGGEGGQAALTRLENLFARTRANWRTATAEESFEIVQRRVFKELAAEGRRERDAVVRAFSKMYQSHTGEFPPECREGDYQRRMKATYPIHPELFDRLFGEWSTLERFQRTRGVLRIMAEVVHALWIGDDPNLLIMPSTIPVDDIDVAEELMGHLDPAWRTVVETDVDGSGALPLRLDREHPSLGRHRAARKVARTVYFGTAPSQQVANRGLDDRSIKLGCLQPGTERPAVYGDALRRLSDQAMYLYRDGTRYWYALQPTVNRMARDRAENHFGDADADEVIRGLVDDALRRDRGLFAGVHVCPRSPADVPDEDEVRLVALDPTAPHDTKVDRSEALRTAERILLERSGGARQFSNMLVFLAADAARLRDLRQAVRSCLAWDSIDRDADSLGLDEFQKRQTRAKVAEAHDTVKTRVGETYIWALHPMRPPEDPTGEIRWERARLTSSASLAERVSRKLDQDEALIRQYAGTRLRLDLDRVPLWRDGPDGERLSVSVKQLWEDFTRYLYLPRLLRRSVLEDAIRNGVADTAWSTEGFAYADGHNGERYVGLRAAEQLSSVAPSGLVVHPDAAARQFAQDEPESPPTEEDDDTEGVPKDPIPVIEIDAPPHPPKPTRYYGRVTLASDRWTLVAADIAEGVVQRLDRTEGAEIKVTIEIEATAEAGFDEETQADIAENSITLKFNASDFED